MMSDLMLEFAFGIGLVTGMVSVLILLVVCG
jgi:hypothetical protein